MYLGTVILRRTERQFWQMTPKKLTALAKAHTKVHGEGSEENEKGPAVGFIDQVI